MKTDFLLRITTSMPERLVNAALMQGAEFAEVRRISPRTILVSGNESAAKLMQALCKQYRIDCKILRRQGKPVLRERMRSRITLFPALILCAILCALVLSRVWLIDVRFTHAAAPGQEAMIHSLLRESGVHPGMRAKNLDASVLQKQLLAQTGAYSHIGVRRQGICLLIEAAAETPAPEVYDLNQSRDLVSAMDGVVASVNVRSGQACVSVGDTVRKGQLLIRGEEQKTKEETAAVSALGEIRVRSWFEGSAEGYLKQKQTRRTGRTATSNRLRLLNHSFTLGEAPSFTQSESETQILPIVGLFLPLEIRRETMYETQAILSDADPDALLQCLIPIAQADARAKLAKNPPEAYEITRYWEESTMEDNVLRLRAVYEITANAAVTRDSIVAMDDAN